MNEGGSYRIPEIEELCRRSDILCIHEQFLRNNSLSLLKFSDNHKFYFATAKSRQRRSSSGELVIVIRSAVDSEGLYTAENFVAVRVGNLVIVNIYLLTSDSNKDSVNQFSKAVRAPAKCPDTPSLSKLERVIIDDYSCDLVDDLSPQSQLILSVLEIRYRILPKDKYFTFVHTSGSVSNIDPVAGTPNVSGTVSVLKGSHSANHISIEACVSVCIKKAKSTSQWNEIKDWSDADFPLYHVLYSA